MNWLKKGPVLGTLGGLLILWLLAALFFDPILRHGLIRAAQAAAGAKVEIHSLSTKWLKGTLELRGLSVADREQPMKNLFEFSRLAFHLDMGAALRGKVVIREAALEGLRLGTPRRTSGALRRAPPSRLEKAVHEQLAPVQARAAAKVSRVKSLAVGRIDATKLAGIKKYDETKTLAQDTSRRWKGASAEAQKIDAEAKQISEQLKGLGRKGDVLQQVAQAKDAQGRIQALIARVDAQKARAQKDLAQVQDGFKQAEALRQKDLGSLLAEAGLPNLDSQGLARQLLGAQSAARLATALRWMRWAREHAASKSAPAPAPAARRRGVNVEFPRRHLYPQFLLEGARITGTLSDLYEGQDMALAGQLNGVTSNPRLYGKPATLDLAGKAAGGAAMSLSARLDQQKSPVGLDVRLSGSGFSLAGGQLGDGGDVGAVVKEGQARVKAELRSEGQQWSGAVLVQASALRLEPKVALAGLGGQLAGKALAGLKGFQVHIGISGTEEDLKLTFSSDAGDVLASAMKKAFSSELEAQRQALTAQLETLYAGKASEARAQATGLQGQLLGPLEAQRGRLDGLLKDATQKAVGRPKIPGLDRLFK